MPAETPRPQTFHAWLVDLLRPNLGAPDACVFWFDPADDWNDLLAKVAADEGWGYWDGALLHELELRYRLVTMNPGPRIVRLPFAPDEVTWAAVLVPQARTTFSLRLADALRAFGAEISWEREQELGSTLKVYGLQWINEPALIWKANGTVIILNDGEILDLIAHPRRRLAELSPDLFTIFARRIVLDFGLPDPTGMDEDRWRTEVVAALLVTEAAALYPGRPSPDPNRIISVGAVRDRALATLLGRWRDSATCAETFERLVPLGERLTSLRALAADLPDDARPSSSHIVEQSLFSREIRHLATITGVRDLARYLADRQAWYACHAASFFGTSASPDRLVPWRQLAELARSAETLCMGEGAGDWPTTEAALAWYVSTGWRIDAAGESLFEDRDDLSDELEGIQARLRRLYHQLLSHVGTRFSERLASDPNGLGTLPTAGERVQTLLTSGEGPVVFLFLDALRFDLGQRLAELLNEGEGSPRASVYAARAPLPSITPIGKPHSLPIASSSIHVDYGENGAIQVHVDGYDRDVSVAEQWRGWFRQTLEVKHFSTIDTVLTGEIKHPSRSTSMLVVEGGELDKTGTIGELQMTGATPLLRRYAKAIRRLRDRGWNRFVITTDHGFFHWQPEKDEIVKPQVSNTLLTSRRAIVGRSLSSSNALSLPASGSDLTVLVPYSTNAFQTYGGLGFFHGGATLQELVIPVLSVEWPRKTREVKVVLKHVGQISSLTPRVQVEAAVSGQQTLGVADPTLSGRRVVIKVRDENGRLVFKQKEPVTVEPGGGVVTVVLALVAGAQLAAGAPLVVAVEDAETEECLEKESVELRQDIDDW